MDSKEYELLSRLEAEVRKLTAAQATAGILGVIREINEYRRKRAQRAKTQPQIRAWQP